MNEWTASIARIDEPAPGLLCLTLKSGSPTGVLVVSTQPGGWGMGLVDERPRGATADTATTQLRHHLVGALIQSVELGSRFAQVTATRDDGAVRLVMAARKPAGAWWVLDEKDETLVHSPGAPHLSFGAKDRLDLQVPVALKALGAKTLEQHRDARVGALVRVFERERKRLAKKRDAVRADLERTKEADSLFETGNWILAHAHEIPANSSVFEAPAWDDPSRSVRIVLDPQQSPSAYAQQLFHKGKRLRRGAQHAEQRLADVERELKTLTDAREACGSDPATLEATLSDFGLLRRTSQAGPRDRTAKRKQPRLPYREFTSVDGLRILVGRGAADNDQLTLRVAKPHDLWLHARGSTGAHVVVQLQKGKSCPQETLLDAATLAAHFSDLRGEPIVDVLQVPRRYVRKKKGSAVGSVTLDREKVLALRVESQRIKRLLQHERRTP